MHIDAHLGLSVVLFGTDGKTGEHHRPRRTTTSARLATLDVVLNRSASMTGTAGRPVRALQFKSVL